MSVKPNKKILRNMDNGIVLIRRAIANAQVIIDGKDTELWKAIKQMAESVFETAEAKLDNFRKLSDKEIWCALQERQDSKIFISMPEDFESKMEELQDELKNALARRADYNVKLEKV